MPPGVISRLGQKLMDWITYSSPIYERHITGEKPLILEAATGFGLNLGILLRRAERLGGAVVSVDIDEKSVARARSMYRDHVERGLLRVEVGDLRSLRYTDDSFDYAVNHTTMHHVVGDAGKVLEEHYRTLKPGGKLIIIDLNPHIISPHLPSLLRRSKEEVMREVPKLFEIIESGNRRRAYYIVARKRP